MAMRKLNIPSYSAEELVRLELLAYSTPEGLHPVEFAWREIARKLLQHTKELQSGLDDMNKTVKDYSRVDFPVIKFPKPFSTTTNDN